jgi:hypothetical protein
VLAHGFAEVAQVLELVAVGELHGALLLQEVHRAAKALAQLGIVERGARAGAKVLGGNEMQGLLAHRAVSPSVTITTHSLRGPCAP